MVIPMLEEVEQMWTLGPGQVHGPWAEQTATSILALVAHVRGLYVMTAGIDAMQGSHGVSIRNAAERIMALEAKVAACGAAEAEDAANAKNVKDRALSRANEREHLRAENERLLKEKHHLQNGIDASRAEIDRLRAENAELRKANANVQSVAAEYEERIKTMQEQVARLRRDLAAGGWPAPQPIETAPLERIMVPRGPEWSVQFPYAGESVDDWRAYLARVGHKIWIPAPPPPAQNGEDRCQKCGASRSQHAAPNMFDFYVCSEFTTPTWSAPKPPPGGAK